jgi:hypothetical protein
MVQQDLHLLILHLDEYIRWLRWREAMNGDAGRSRDRIRSPHTRLATRMMVRPVKASANYCLYDQMIGS